MSVESVGYVVAAIYGSVFFLLYASPKIVREIKRQKGYRRSKQEYKRIKRNMDALKSKI